MDIDSNPTQCEHTSPQERAIPHSELVHIGLANQHCARVLEFAHDRCVVRRDEARERLGRGGGLHALRAEIVLDGDWHAVERAERFACAFEKASERMENEREAFESDGKCTS